MTTSHAFLSCSTPSVYTISHLPLCPAISIFSHTAKLSVWLLTQHCQMKAKHLSKPYYWTEYPLFFLILWSPPIAILLSDAFPRVCFLFLWEDILNWINKQIMQIFIELNVISRALFLKRSQMSSVWLCTFPKSNSLVSRSYDLYSLLKHSTFISIAVEVKTCCLYFSLLFIEFFFTYDIFSSYFSPPSNILPSHRTLFNFCCQHNSNSKPNHALLK